MFTKGKFHYAMVGTQISPRRAVQNFRQCGMDVLFLAEGDGSLARACLEDAPLAPLPSQDFDSWYHLPEGCLARHRYHRDGWVATYAEGLERAMLRRHDPLDFTYGSPEAMSTAHAAQQAAETWAAMRPTSMLRCGDTGCDAET